MTAFGLMLSSCSSRDEATSNESPVDSIPGNTTPTVILDDVPIDKAVTATGTVTGPDGQPVTGAMLDPIAVDGQILPGIDSFRRTDDEGHFELALPAGRWDLSISADGYESTSKRITVTDKATVEAEIVLAKALDQP
jgi:hypothetical protein